MAHEAHARVKFGTPDIDWDTNTIPAAVVELTTFEGRPVDRFDVPVSENGVVMLPFLGNIADDQRYLATLKVPGNLSKTFAVSMLNVGNSIRIQELVSGDVNDDDCVTEKDFRLTSNDEGEGGQDADAVPFTDANSDGIVNALDLELIEANLGQCGGDDN